MEWEFEPGHTAAEFRCRHMMVTWVRGHFKNVAGRLTFDPRDPGSASAETEIEVASLWTGEPDRDQHLLHSDFLDAENHPTLSFRSGSVDVLSPTEWQVHGELTIRGVTRPNTLHVQHFGQWDTPYWEDGVDKGPLVRAGFCAETVIDRHEFGVSWNSELPGGGIVVGKDVFITIDVEALRTKNQP